MLPQRFYVIIIWIRELLLESNQYVQIDSGSHTTEYFIYANKLYQFKLNALINYCDEWVLLIRMNE